LLEFLVFASISAGYWQPLANITLVSAGEIFNILDPEAQFMNVEIRVIAMDVFNEVYHKSNFYFAISI